MNNPTKWFVSGCLMIVMAVAWMVASPDVFAAPKAIYNVTRFDDPAPGTCDLGDCSLREAVMAANANPGSTVTLPAGTYDLTIPPSNPDSTSVGDLDLWVNVTISGAGSATTIIQGGAGWSDRIFDVWGGGQVQITGVSIQKGNVSANEGGGIYIGSGVLTLTNCIVTNNIAGTAGGGIQNHGTVTLNSSTVISNSASGGGGGISNWGALTLNNTQLISNTATGVQSGGGLFTQGAVTLTSSSVMTNTAGSGGGIYNGSLARTTISNSTVIGNISTSCCGGIMNAGGMLAMVNTSVNNNIAATDAGGIYNDAMLTISNSTIGMNRATDAGGGFTNSNAGVINISNSAVYSNTAGVTSDGGGFTNFGTLTLTNTQVYSNTAQNGGGIFNSGATVNVISSTIRNNIAANGGGIYSNDPGSGTRSVTLRDSSVINNAVSGANPNGVGGGILSGTAVTLTNTTIASNSARQGGGLWLNLSPGITATLNNVTIFQNTATESGGGYYTGGASGSKTIKNTIIAGNIGNVISPDCSGALASAGYNLLGNDTGCTFGSTTGDQVGTNASPINPLLAPLGNYGGPTLTNAPYKGSPVIDAGNPLAPGSGGDACIAKDQRGGARPQAARCDIGAVEMTLHLQYLPIILK